MSRNIPKALRRLVIERDSQKEPFECPFCHFEFLDIEDPNISLDHIIPQARGGQTIEENLQVACLSCNQSKVDSASPIINRRKILRVVLCSCGTKFNILDFDYHVNIDLVETNALLCIGCGGEEHDEYPPDEHLDSRFIPATKSNMKKLGL